jgi:hypothetical protein
MRRGEIVKLSHLWRAPNGHPWLVTFELTEMSGRLECVGMSIRSYVLGIVREHGEPEQVLVDLKPDDAAESEGLWSVLYELALDAGVPSKLASESAEEQQAALDEIEAGEPFRPHALTALTLRRLPFGDVLQRARRESAQDALRWADHTDDPGRELREWAERVEQPHARRPGRQAKYNRADLERVAALQRAAARHSASPTKDVAEVLGVTRNVAAKLIMRCRREGLLPPAERLDG